MNSGSFVCSLDDSGNQRRHGLAKRNRFEVVNEANDITIALLNQYLLQTNPPLGKWMFPSVSVTIEQEIERKKMRSSIFPLVLAGAQRNREIIRTRSDNFPVENSFGNRLRPRWRQIWPFNPGSCESSE